MTTADDLTQFKSLLLSDQTERIDALEREIASLRARLGDDDGMQKAMTPVIAQALAQANHQDPAAITRVVSPVVVASLQRHLKHSPDDIVEVMYPITGRMVSSTVINAIRSLSESINEQMEVRFSVKGQLARMRAKQTGRPISDFLVAKSIKANLQRALILDRDSGNILNSWQQDTDSNDGQDNVELVSAMLAALNNLAQQAFEDSAGGLRTLDLDGRQIALRSSARHLIALEFTGVLSSNEQKHVDEAFSSAVDHLLNEDNESAMQELVHVAEKVQTVEQPTNSSQTLDTGIDRKPWLAVVVPLCLIVALSFPFKHYQKSKLLDQDVTKAADILSQNPKLIGFPITASANHDAGSIFVSGLIPKDMTVSDLRDELEQTLKERPIRLSVSHVLTEKPWPTITSATNPRIN